MKSRSSSLFVLISTIICLLGGTAGVALLAHENHLTQQNRASSAKAALDKAAIDRLHQLDVQTTLTDKADELTKLWDSEAVRIQPGRPAEIGKAAIYADDQQEEANPGGGRTVCYNAEMQDLQVAGDWAFEWGYFSYKNSGDPKPGRGKVLRVMKRQPDGSWKFARVIGFTEKLESAAPMSHPCQ